jgi:hypothetical protein
MEIQQLSIEDAYRALNNIADDVAVLIEGPGKPCIEHKETLAAIWGSSLTARRRRSSTPTTSLDSTRECTLHQPQTVPEGQLISKTPIWDGNTLPFKR